jgi:hypothetical protein
MISTRNKVSSTTDPSTQVEVNLDWFDRSQQKTEETIEILKAARRLTAAAKKDQPRQAHVELTVIDRLLEKALNLLVEAQSPW